MKTPIEFNWNSVSKVIKDILKNNSKTYLDMNMSDYLVINNYNAVSIYEYKWKPKLLFHLKLNENEWLPNTVDLYIRILSWNCKWEYKFKTVETDLEEFPTLEDSAYLSISSLHPLHYLLEELKINIKNEDNSFLTKIN